MVFAYEARRGACTSQHLNRTAGSQIWARTFAGNGVPGGVLLPTRHHIVALPSYILSCSRTLFPGPKMAQSHACCAWPSDDGVGGGPGGQNYVCVWAALALHELVAAHACQMWPHAKCFHADANMSRGGTNRIACTKTLFKPDLRHYATYT